MVENIFYNKKVFYLNYFKNLLNNLTPNNYLKSIFGFMEVKQTKLIISAKSYFKIIINAIKIIIQWS